MMITGPVPDPSRFVGPLCGPQNPIVYPVQLASIKLRSLFSARDFFLLFRQGIKCQPIERKRLFLDSYRITVHGECVAADDEIRRCIGIVEDFGGIAKGRSV